jgi:hypothetical protein
MKMANLAHPGFFVAWGKINRTDNNFLPTFSLKVKKTNDYLLSQHKLFNELREAILNKYGTKDDKGQLIVTNGNIEFKNEHLNDVNKEFNDLTGIELDPAAPYKLNLQTLEDGGVRLSAPDLDLLGDLLDLGEEEKPKPALSLVPPTA